MTDGTLNVERSGNLKDAEAIIFKQTGACDAGLETPALFILGAPRSGSTVLYQLVASAFRLPFISNLTNEHFAAAPIVGIALQAALPPWDHLSDKNNYGKTEAAHEPHEGSAVVANWFGGGHPSQLVSAEIKPGREPHMRATLAASHRIFSRPLLIKNAWNCFRVTYLASAFPAANFIWIRRDIAEAASSDLNARYVTKHDPNAWNSATPAHVDELRKLHYTAQVIENQVAFNEAVGHELSAGAAGRFAEVWYEDLCAAPQSTVDQLRQALPLLREQAPQMPSHFSYPVGAPRERLSRDDNAAIDRYLSDNIERLASHRHVAPR